MPDEALILIAEDREDDVLLIRRAFEKAGVTNPTQIVRNGEETMAYLLNTFYIKYKIPFAGFHPKFIAEHVIAACNYLGTPPKISRQLLADSLENMVILPTTSTPE